MKVHDFYNNNVDIKLFEDPHTFDILNIKLLNLDSNIDGGTLKGNNNFSGTNSAYTIKNHFNTCKNSRILGSFKAKKYIFPREIIRFFPLPQTVFPHLLSTSACQYFE